MANLDSEWEFTWLSQANVFLQLDDTGSTGTTTHRQTREKKTFKTLAPGSVALPHLPPGGNIRVPVREY